MNHHDATLKYPSFHIELQLQVDLEREALLVADLSESA